MHLGQKFLPQPDLPGRIRGFKVNPRQVGISAASGEFLPRVKSDIAIQKPSPLPNTDQVVSSMIADHISFCKAIVSHLKI